MASEPPVKRKSVDSQPAYIMLVVIVLSAAAITVTWWLTARPRVTLTEQAFKNQPVGLVIEPEDFLASRPVGVGDCPQVSTEVFAVDVADGSIAWRQTASGPASNFFGEWYVLYDDDGPTVLAQIDRELLEVPPSIRAIDIATGQLAWQYFLNLREVSRSAQSDTALAVQGFSATDVGEEVTLAVDAAGELIDNPPVQFDRDRPFDPAAQLGAGYRLTSDVADLVTDGSDQRQVYAGGGDGGRIDIRTVADGATVEGDRIPFGDGFDVLGSSSSPGEPIQANDDLILATIGSSVGPNTRLAVFDGSTGSLSWSLSDVRAGAVAGQQILYDIRNDEPVDAVSTRDLYLVDGDDPDDVVWSTALNVNESGGNGFLGMAGDDLVFAVKSDRFPLEFLVVADERDVPARLDAAEGYGSGPSPLHHVDEEIFIAGVDGGVRMELADGELIGIETEEPVSWVRRVGDVVLVVAPRQPVCG